MSLRLRLTLQHSLVLVVVMSTFALVVYVAQERMLDNSLNATLRDQAREYSSTSRLVRFDVPTERIVVSAPDPNVFAAPNVFVQVADRNGEIAGRSSNLGEATLPYTSAMLQDALKGKEWFEDVTVDGEPLRMLLAPLRVSLIPGESVNLGMVQVARPLAQTYGTLRMLQATFLVVGAVGVLMSLVAGWLLARSALRPIDRLAAAAHAIGTAQDFGQRVPAPATARRDEVGRLAEEFNEMLARLQAAYEQLESTLASQRRFVADASHELRTPLTSLRGNVELMRRMAALEGAMPPPDEQDLLLADMASETERMARLVGDLLLLAQADAGQHLPREPLALSPVVREAFRAARFLKEDVRLELGAVTDAAWVQGDADRLKQLFLILLDNALKYTPEGGTVAIEAATQVRDGVAGVVTRVRDTGCGIPPEDSARIFERFFRSDTARADGGAGLGLAIARWIAEEHGGTIEVESVPGRGSVFSVWLPLAGQDHDATRDSEGREEAHASRGAVRALAPTPAAS